MSAAGDPARKLADCPDRSQEITSRSTRARSSTSAPHASLRKASRASGARSRAASASERTVAHRSGESSAREPGGRSGAVIAQLLVEPALRHHPVAGDRPLGDAEGLRGLRLGEPGEEAALDDAGEALL